MLKGVCLQMGRLRQTGDLERLASALATIASRSRQRLRVTNVEGNGDAPANDTAQDELQNLQRIVSTAATAIAQL